MTQNKNCIFYLVRHGETEWNQKNLVQGHTDIPIAEAGKKQARERAASFKEISFDHVVSSDLTRAKETASILSEGRSLTIHTSSSLREQSWGSWEGHSFDKLREMFGTGFNSYSGNNPHAVPGVESHREVALRVKPFLKELASNYPGNNILVVTHGGVLKGLIFHLGIEELFGRHFDNLGFIKIEYERGNFKFLEAQGLKGHYN